MANVLKKGVLHRIMKFKFPLKIVGKAEHFKLDPDAWKAPS